MSVIIFLVVSASDDRKNKQWRHLTLTLFPCLYGKNLTPLLLYDTV